MTANTTGYSNTAVGVTALDFNTTGFGNIAIGGSALGSNRTGSSNTATGLYALISNNHGNDNTATGFNALYANTTGNDNTAIGFEALSRNRGSSNIALGSGAGSNLTMGNANIYIGNAGISSAENAKIRIGTTGTQLATFIAGISGVTVPSGIGVIVGTDGKLGTVVSSERFKDSIRPMDKASEAILALKPVTFRYKHQLDPEGIPQFGLVAEDVEKVNPDLVARDADGKAYSVRYDAVNAMLLNEFLKEHRKNEEQQAMIARLEKQIETLTDGLQRVNAQLAKRRIRVAAATGLEAGRRAQQIVLNDQ